MKNEWNVLRVACVAIAMCATLAFAAEGIAAGADWPPIAPADLALAKPRIDANADAEVLLWDVRVTDSDEREQLQTIQQHHLRIKIFTERGRETYSKVEIPYVKNARVRDVEGRTVSPTGAVAELRSQDVFDRTVIETNGTALKAKSFVLPAVTPGSIIEYRWREIRDDSMADGVQLPFYRDIPVHAARYHIKPLAIRELGYQMRLQAFNVRGQPSMKNEERGYTLFELLDVPAVRREPFMPPSLSLGPWMLVYYADLATVDRPVDRFWLEFGKAAFGVYKPELRVTGPIRTSAADATKTAATTPDKIDALVRFVRAKVKRTDAGTRKRKENRSAADALSRGVGDGHDQTMLFAALATAAGLQTRLAMLPDRSDFLSEPAGKQPYFLRHLAVAVRDGDAWLFVDPANRHAKGGHLAWEYEGQYALLLDEKTPEIVSVPLEEPGVSMRKRTAALKLLDDGTLEGDVTLEYTGQIGAQRRERDVDEAAAERERDFAEDYGKRVPGAELSGFSFENLDNPEVPYTVRFKLRAPGYGQRTGSRMLVQPAVFERGAEARFSASTRQYHMYFPFAWGEQDTVTIDLPDGYAGDGELEPQGAGLGDGTGFYRANVTLSPDARRVTYTRSFFFGAKGALLFQPSEYNSVKAFFAAVDRNDGYTLSLRRQAAGSAK
jgi:Domain of Unknown Function with PDB structure (DUF3857)/Transglutaminase-like superfamily